MSTQIEGGNWYQECQQLRAQLAETQRERDELRLVQTFPQSKVEADLRTQLQSQAAQLVRARELEVQMTATGARANLALIKERDALSAQLAGMREALEEIVKTGYTGAEYVARQALAAWEGKAESRQSHQDIPLDDTTLERVTNSINSRHGSKSYSCGRHGWRHAQSPCPKCYGEESKA